MVGAFAPTIQRFVRNVKPTADFLKRALQAAEVLELLLVYFLSCPCHTCPPFFGARQRHFGAARSELNRHLSVGCGTFYR